MQNAPRRPRHLFATLGLFAALVGAIGFAGRLAAQGPPGGPGGPPGGGSPGGPGGGPGAAPAAPPPPVRSNLSFAGANGNWAWLTQVGDKDTLLFVAPAGQEGKEVARGQGWTSVALEGDTTWIAAPKGNAGALLRVGEGGTPEEAVRCNGKPSGLRVQNDRLYWAERRVATPEAPSFIPTLSDQVVVRVREKDGQVRDLASWPAGADPKSAIQLPEVVAVSESALYLRVPRLYSTEFVEIQLAGGEPKRIAIEAEVQYGALYRGVFHWTARSREATLDVGMRRVSRFNGAEAEVVAEWLPASGSLVAMEDALYYVAEGVYRIPDKLAMPKRLGRADATRGALDPKGLVLIDPPGGRPPVLFTEE